LDYGLVSGKVRGLIAKCSGKLITGRIIFLKKNLCTESIEQWTGLGVAPVHGLWWTRLHTPSRLHTLDFDFDGQEQIGEWAAAYGSGTGHTRRWGLLEPTGMALWWLCAHHEGTGRGRSGRRGTRRSMVSSR
jgi:hypothetical protein